MASVREFTEELARSAEEQGHDEAAALLRRLGADIEPKPAPTPKGSARFPRLAK